MEYYRWIEKKEYEEKEIEFEEKRRELNLQTNNIENKKNILFERLKKIIELKHIIETKKITFLRMSDGEKFFHAENKANK